MVKSTFYRKTETNFMELNNPDKEPEILGFLNAADDLTPEGIAAIKAIACAGYNLLKQNDCNKILQDDALNERMGYIKRVIGDR